MSEGSVKSGRVALGRSPRARCCTTSPARPLLDLNQVLDPGPPRHFFLSFLGFSIANNYCTSKLYLLTMTKATTNLVKRYEDVPQRLRFSPNAEFAIHPSPPILMRWPWSWTPAARTISFKPVSQFGDQVGEVGREGGFDADRLFGEGVDKAQGLGVQGLAGERDRELGPGVRPVDRVDDDRVSDLGQMDVDLVGPAGLESASHQAGNLTEALEDLEVSHGGNTL